jgi:hypothetical protein
MVESTETEEESGGAGGVRSHVRKGPGMRTDGWKVCYLGTRQNPTRYTVEIMPGTLAIVTWFDDLGRHGAALWGVSSGRWTYKADKGAKLPAHVRRNVERMVTA